MRRIARAVIWAGTVAMVLPFASGLRAQANGNTRYATSFFDSIAPVEVTLTTNLGRIRRDKSQNSPWRPATVTLKKADGTEAAIPARIRTRGIWRLKTCEFPPLRLNFAAAHVAGTPFQGLDRPKLVNYCRNTDNYEQYLLQEHQLYRIHNLLTPASHRSRLVRLTLVDSATGKPMTTRYSIILEEPRALAARIDGKLVEEKGARAGDLDPYHNAFIGVFQYFIGNTDFSISALHNVELYTAANHYAIIPVPYDFDFSGAVNAPYATVDPSLSVNRVRDRLFRGYCASSDEYAKVFALFNEKKDAIYALYNDEVGRLLKPNIVKETLQYFDEFYRTINDPGMVRRQILEACLQRS